MRTELINNDINLFLTSEPDIFQNTIKKRIKTWRTATDYQGFDFLTLIFIKISNEPSVIPVNEQWSVILDKLVSLEFELKSFHYFPKMYLGTSHNTAICTHYKELIQQLQDRNVIFDSDMLKSFVSTQNGSIDNSIATVFKGLSPDFEKENLKQQVKNTIDKLLDEFYEMMLLKKTSKKTRIERSSINAVLDVMAQFGGDPVSSQVDDYLNKQDKKIDFILNYVNSYSLTQEEAKELLLCFRPCGEVMINLDRIHHKSPGTHSFAYISINSNGLLRPRHYFTEKQIDVMDKIQDKFNVQILENP